jgi:hypothetical protein
MKNSGFKNEKKLVNALHQKKYTQLNSNLQKLIAQSFKNYSEIINCKQEAGTNKSDLLITIGEESHSYSVKKGSGNSIHQEPIAEFIDYLTKEHNLSKKTSENLQRFIWADGTVDGTGEVKSRLSSKKFKKRDPKAIEDIQNFFDGLKEPLLRRFLINGVHSNSSAEFIYYGTPKKGTVCKSEDVLTWLATHDSKATLHIGKLSFQAWNRNLKGKREAEKKRGVIQLKWGGLKKDIRKIAKTNLGKLQEIDFVKELNRKESLKYWQTLELDPNVHYAIRIKYTKFGKLQQKKVWAKADAFIAKGSVPKEYLKEKDFFLNEDDMKKFNLKAVEQSGISIKQKKSHNYQIVKISPSSFKKLFGSNILAAGASLYYKKRKHLIRNKSVLDGWDITEEEFFSFYSHSINKNVGSVVNPNCQKCLKKIKRYAKKEIHKKVKDSPYISKLLFMGIENFEEPFTAPWLYEGGVFRKNSIMPFSVTTGSGRSRGSFTIVLKPKG